MRTAERVIISPQKNIGGDALQKGLGEQVALKERELGARPDISFERYKPGIRIEVPWLIPLYRDAGVMKPEYDFRARLGPEVLYHADLEADLKVAERVGAGVVKKRGKTPDIVIVCTSYLPPFDPNSKEPQQRANHVRQYIHDNAERLGIIPPDEANKDNTKTISAACSSGVVALDWLREKNPVGSEVLLVLDETGYRRTITEPLYDKGYAGLLFSDRAIAMQFLYGEGLTVLSSWSEFDGESEQERKQPLLQMPTPQVHDNEYLIVKRPPYAPYFQMQGADLRTYFADKMMGDDFAMLLPSLSQYELTFLLQHQSSVRMVNSVYASIFKKISSENVRFIGHGIGNYGNTSSASIFFDLQDGIEGRSEVNTVGENVIFAQGGFDRTIGEGDNGLIIVYGAGLTRGYAHSLLGKLSA